MNNNIHVLIIPSWYPQDINDIGGSFFREQAIALSSAGHNVGVIYLKNYSLKQLFSYTPNIKIEVDSGVATYRDSFINYTPKFKSLILKNWLRKGVKLFDKYVKDNGKPDVIHAHSLFNGGLLALKLSQKYQIPYVITEHSTAFVRNLISPYQLSKAKLAVEGASCCIAVSNEFKSLLNERFSTDKWTYIPNIVSEQFLTVDINSTKKERSTFRFVNVCLLNSKKKVDVLIKAFAILNSKVDNIELEIGGEGPELESLIELATSLGVNHLIKFHGKLSRTRVIETISEADSFVLTSEFETFGVVLIEALALGKPIIATKCGGPESIVTPEVGFLVDKNSPEAVADAMLSLYKNKQSYSSKKMRDYCKKTFSEQAVIKQLSNVYNDVC